MKMMKMAEKSLMKAFIFFICFRASYSIEKSANLSTLYHNSFLVLQCQVSTTGCCQEAKRIEFRKNGRGVCNLMDCTGAFAIPQFRDDTKFYRCFCPGSDFRTAHLLITETRISDYGSWTCECTDRNTDKVCKSHELVVSETSMKEDIVPICINETESKMTVGVVVSFVTVSILFIGAIIGILIVVRCYISGRVKIVHGNRLTRLCLGRGSIDYETEGLNSPTAGPGMSPINEGPREESTSSIKPVWCICSECEDRPTNSEKLCCGRDECITNDAVFESRCFKDIDDTPFSSPVDLRERRGRVYKNYVNWGYGIFSLEDNLLFLPSCCVKIIRKKYPDPGKKYKSTPDSAYPFGLISQRK